ncbi:hypothetical protein [Methanoculleus sp.]|uniref:hypothetical protein n=1 Tax=Methanoculleus sp. TaxID=90427 RepID=UPI0025CDBB11|nr:hypothetical protein [Methanoculleus sp.]MCK9319082.1 hypothetical protein [Methanoculleus sp.]
MKEKIKELKKQFKDTLVKKNNEHYNDNTIYIKIVGKNYLVLDKTTTKNGIETKIFQTTDDAFKAKRFTFDEAIDDFFRTNNNQYNSFYKYYKGFGVFELSYDYGDTKNIFEEYLDLEEDKKEKENESI